MIGIADRATIKMFGWIPTCLQLKQDTQVYKIYPTHVLRLILEISALAI